MKIKFLKTEFFTCTVKNHKKHKPILLSLIDKMPFSRSQDTTKSDWLLPPDQKREYLDYFYSNVIDDIMDEQAKYFKADQWHIHNAWFQQYKNAAFHKYHNHNNTNWANVYFIELPSPTLKTTIKIRDKTFDYTAKEGQVITWPAHLLHTSKPISSKRKTVIAFNSDFSFK